MKSLTALLAISLALLALACQEEKKVQIPTPPVTLAITPTATPILRATSTPSPVIGRTQAMVTRVIDGDTIEIEAGLKVRYIGIDTPETVHPSKPVECFGQEASNRNRELVEGKIVELEKDVSETDRYGRLLRYVYLDGQMVNEILVRQGYAQVSTYPPDVKYVDLFLAVQREAREANRGLWGVCVAEPSPSNNCHPSYPDVCIPPPPPDLNCGDIPYKRFKVLPPDPHRFDGDKDGIGCER